MKSLVAITTLLLALPALGAPTNVRVTSGTSAVIGEPITQVWGAMIGVADNSQTEPYSNCGDDNSVDIEIGGGEDFSGCNPLRVNGNHTITIEFTEPDELTQSVAPVAIIRQGANTDGNTQPILIGTINQQQARIGSNQTGTLSFTWADLCNVLKDSDGSSGTIENNITGVNRCVNGSTGEPINGSLQVTYGFQTAPGTQDTTSQAVLNFFLLSSHEPSDTTEVDDGDASTTPDPTEFQTFGLGIMPQGCVGENNLYGFCDVTFFPGDEGAVINPPDGFTERTNQLINGATANIQGRTPFAATSGNLSLTIEKLRIYYTSLTWNDAHPSGNPEQFVELLLDTQNSTSTPVFRDTSFSGLENGKAFLLRAATVDSSGSITHLFGDDFCPNGAASTPADCPDYTVTPSEIAGLITDSSCFITSATFGSPQAHQVTTFRQFRSKYMWPNKIGRFIARRYNRYGPAGAKWVYQNPSSKKYIRAALMPFYGFAYLSVHFGFALATLTYLLGLVVFVWGFNKAFSRGRVS